MQSCSSQKDILQKQDEEEKSFDFNCLLIGDNDLIGNKFNGHDLHLYLRSNNVEANHFVQEKKSQDIYTYTFDDANKNNNLMEGIINSDLFSKADVIHLHIIELTKFDINYLPLITRLKPTVITLHCSFLFGGHCIHHYDCEKWKQHCFDCSYLDTAFSIKDDVTAINFALKKMAIQNSNLSVIVASKWMEDKVKQSPIWENKSISRIPFGLNREVFKPLDKAIAKKKLGINPDSPVIMFRSDYCPYKNLDLIKEALSKLKTDKEITLITTTEKVDLGNLKNKYKIKQYEYIQDSVKLAELYQASDIFLQPSTQESFGMMAIEAMSCGTMVLSIEGTALTGVINSPECGIAVGTDNFTKELQRLIENPQEIALRGVQSSEYAKENYDKDIYIQKIIDIYKTTIKNHTLTEDASLILSQIDKHSVKVNLNYVYSDSERFIYRVFFRPLLKIIYGKNTLKQKYDSKYLKKE